MNILVQSSNLPPTANAGPDLTAKASTNVELNGSAVDTDGTIVSYGWKQLSGTSGTLKHDDTVNTYFRAPEVLQNEDLAFQLTVLDNDGEQASDVVKVTIMPQSANTPPTANAEDPDGTIDFYEWKQLSGTEVTLEQPNNAKAFFYAPNVKEDTRLTFQLTATDNDGGQDTDSTDVTVKLNTPPTIEAGPDITIESKTLVTIVAIANDPDGNILSYSWVKVSGRSISVNGTETNTIKFTAPDIKQQETFIFEVTVEDDEGSKASDSVKVIVNPENKPLSVDAGEDQVVPEKSKVTLSGTGTDIDGHINKYVWRQVAGNQVPLIGGENESAYFNAPEVDSEHQLVMQLTVTDNKGKSSSDKVEVTVIPIPEDDQSKLLWPIECEPEVDCHIGHADIDGDGFAFNCEEPGYLSHEGVDIALSGREGKTEWQQMDLGVSVYAAQAGEVLWAFDDINAFDKCTATSDHPDCNSPTEKLEPNVKSGYAVCTELGSYCKGGNGQCFLCFNGKNVVVIKHTDGSVFASRYDHLKSGTVLVKKGDKVSRGQKIAEVGSAGKSTGPHLHFEVWSKEYYSLAEPFAGECGPNFEISLWNFNLFPWLVDN
ncbi:PKD domain-containing protein [Pseudoalteromonas spongiae]